VSDSRYSPRHRQLRRRKLRAWRRHPPRPAAFADEALDGELEFEDVATVGGIRLNYVDSAVRHVWEARFRHHRRPRYSLARRRRDAVSRAIAMYVSSRRRAFALRHKDGTSTKFTMTMTFCNHCHQQVLGDADELIHLPGCPCSGESDD
jgi:hypothetical protein